MSVPRNHRPPGVPPREGPSTVVLFEVVLLQVVLLVSMLFKGVLLAMNILYGVQRGMTLRLKS